MTDDVKMGVNAIMALPLFIGLTNLDQHNVFVVIALNLKNFKV